MGIAVLLIIAAVAVFTVVRGKLGAWFSKPISGQPVYFVAPKGPTLWQRTASFIVGALIVAVPGVLLLRHIGEHDDPATNYYTPAVTSTISPATTIVVTPQTTGAH